MSVVYLIGYLALFIAFTRLYTWLWDRSELRRQCALAEADLQVRAIDYTGGSK